MKCLQADLGTARREYISTADNNRYSRVRLEDIEASRMSNIPGSEAQRLAQANKQKLNEWSSKLSFGVGAEMSNWSRHVQESWRF